MSLDHSNARRTLIDDFVSKLDNAVKTSTWNVETLEISDSQKKDINCLYLCFEFLEKCLDYKVSTRLKSLIENLFDKRAEAWKETIFTTKGPKKLAELEEELQKKNEKKERENEEYYQNNKRDNRYNHNEYERRDDKKGHHNDRNNNNQNYDRRDRRDRRQNNDNNKGGGQQMNKYNSDNQKDNKFGYQEKKSSDYFKTENFQRGFTNSKREIEPEHTNSSSTLSRGQGNNYDAGLTKTRSAMPKVIYEKDFDNTKVTADLKKFFKDNKSCEDTQTYIDHFKEIESDWKEAGASCGKEFLTAFLNSYHNCYKSTALIRAKFITDLWKTFSNNVKDDLITPFSQFVYECSIEGLFGDVPH